MFPSHKLRTEKNKKKKKTDAAVWSMRVVVDGLAIFQPMTAVVRLEGKVFLNISISFLFTSYSDVFGAGALSPKL